MSGWLDCKLDLKCTAAVLRRALVNIMPEWERNIEEDPSGSLSAANTTYARMSGPKSGFNLVVRLEDCDIGFKQNADQSWSASYDPHLVPRSMQRSGVDGTILMEVSAMRTRALAEIKGMRVDSDRMEGGNRVIDLLEPIQGPDTIWA